jgi:hypothetical protein
MNKLLFMILVALTVVCVACDDDKDKAPTDPVEVCKCDDATNCPDGDKAKCAEPAKCDPACTETQDCVCAEDKCECREKDVTPTEDPKCDPVCAEDEACKCAEEKCACEKTTPDAEECKCDDSTACPEGGKDACPKHEEVKTCDPVCPEGKECKCTEDECECADVKPAEEPKPETPAADHCEGKSENDECDTNKTCQKGEGDKLECKDKPAAEEPTQPDPKE